MNGFHKHVNTTCRSSESPTATSSSCGGLTLDQPAAHDTPRRVSRHTVWEPMDLIIKINAKSILCLTTGATQDLCLYSRIPHQSVGVQIKSEIWSRDEICLILSVCASHNSEKTIVITPLGFLQRDQLSVKHIINDDTITSMYAVVN